MIERWVSTAALARPVVPLVKISIAGSSSAIGVSGRPASGAWPVMVSRSASRSTCGMSRSGAGEALGPLGVDEQDLGLGELEGVAHLGLGPPAVHGDGDRPDRQARPEREDPAGAVGPAQGDVVAGPDAVDVAEVRGDGRHLVREVVEGDLPPVGEGHGQPVAVGERGGEHLPERARAGPEDRHRLAEHLLGHDLERRAGTGEPLGGGEEVGQRRMGVRRGGGVGHESPDGRPVVHACPRGRRSGTMGRRGSAAVIRSQRGFRI